MLGAKVTVPISVNLVRKKIILVAYDLNPSLGSEAGAASAWLDIISKRFDVTVFTDEIHRNGIGARSYFNTTFHFIGGIVGWRRIARKTGAKWLPAKMFYNKVEVELKRISLSQYGLIQCITPAGIYFSNTIYKLGLPVIVGPLGGGLPTPKGFLNLFRYDIVNTVLRGLFYRFYSKNRGWNQYLIHAERIVIGTPVVANRLPKPARAKCIDIFDTVVDVDLYKPNSVRSKGEATRVLFVGSLIPIKGVTLLVNAVQKLCFEMGIRDFIVEVVGTGPLYEKTANQIDRAGITKYVTLLGGVPKNKLISMYQRADIFCLPTIRENGGTAILEAMACGLPIITSNYGGPSYSVNEDCGIKIEVKNEEQYVCDLTKALAQLIRDIEGRQRMGRCSRERAVNEYSIAALEEKINRLYDEVLV